MAAPRKGKAPVKIRDDENFFKHIITIDYDIDETRDYFTTKDARILKNPPAHSLLYQLRVADKLTYVTIGNSKLVSGTQQLVICRNIAACRMCKELFTYKNKQEILDYYQTHNCQQQSNVKEINTTPSQNINKNLPSLQNNTDFPVCINQYEPIDVENVSILQGVNKNDSSISCTSMKPTRNIYENLCSLQNVDKTGLSVCAIDKCESCRIIGEEIHNLQKVNKSGSRDIRSTNMYEQCGNRHKNVRSLQDVNKKGVCSNNVCESPVNIDMNSVNMEDGNRSDLNICNIRQEDVTEMDLQDYEKSEAYGTAIEDMLSSTDSIIIEDENMELNTTVNITDESVEEISEIPVTDLNDEASAAESIDNVVETHRAMLDICARLTNPVESTVVTDLYNYNLIVTMNEFYKTGRFTDVTVVCENKKIECHRLVLSIFSAHLEEMFRECCTAHSAVVIEGMKFWHVKALIDYMYTSEISVDENQWCSLMEAVDRLQFRDYLRPKKLPRDTANKRICTSRTENC